ncbi:MAG: OmpA family protein [SAR116 cluster bacterium]|nr:MAG: OmpA family protein [SAR116 cluster bacterium]|tara:strand:- start:1149 stop:2402 length:1254 start_codon:yes stop_codon:yes gene_type:complete
MALARLGSNRRSESYTWPGFVDALATLLMVIIFVLMVFVLIQVNLAYRVSGQDATLGEMRQQLVSLTELLNLERKASSDLAADLAQISRELEVTTTERDDILAQLANATDALAASTAENVVLSEKQEATLAALEAARLRLDERLAALTAAEQNLAEANTKLAASETSLASTESSLAAALEKLAQTQQESVEANKQADSLAAENAASRAEILQMTKATTALRQRIEELTTLLGDLEAQATRDKVAIASLGKSLNNALANKVQELQRFRSEFFGRLREVLSGRDEVQIVGDRFVFQSEVLFNQGQANIGNSGEEQLQKLALTLADIATKIPDDINWVLQVEGHTDDIPIRAGRFADNWDLSTERALSVVRFLASQGVPANRLAATGYGEFQPLASGDTDDARRRNRRIELKITQRVVAQ